MENKNILVILLVSLFFTLNANAQTGTYSSRMINSKKVNAFTRGNHPVNTISDNFENLFRNVPQMICNPDSLQFLGYEYVATQDNDSVNPFTYGKKVTTIEDNFENLFGNVKQMVDNPIV